ncbi:serine--tRNA ligase [Candidatus Uhrbacteria bacterium CG_4_9_14_3_um_filter_36_7]|uniref:Serine--tRNA ligase n=1 Tax=Candidatus Uhrbacteria bacterium CG_4_9_14_3_um_filter_36_7 TaxID=1975033 RepID=A0A2M7XHJ3_9BACT|nr:MAG: serine--tRNA ligase [Candidatus Uhrbacteria bacterium CG_4_9_14_3_um_filter_36_7]
MLDLKFILQNPQKVIENNKRRRRDDIDVFLTVRLAEEKKAKQQEVEELRAKINANAALVKQASDTERQGFIQDGQSLKIQIKELESHLVELEQELEQELLLYPNILRDDVKTGSSDVDNEELRKVGQIPEFDFEIKDHVALGESLGLIDSDRAGKVSGSRFTYLKGDLVLLEFALIQYTLTTSLQEKFIPVLPPHIISRGAMASMGYLAHGGEEEVYHLKNDDAVLIGTSEQAIGPMHMNEILKEEELPLRYIGFSPCYRREAGSHGKDVRGILRMHQFDKIEMFSFTTPEQSDQEHLFLLSMEEKLMQGLKLPYRVLRLCSSDIGAPSARTYDIETWMPGQEKYRETHSTSNTTDFQTRRLKIRYKTKEGKNEFAHALNGTAFALGRIMIAILENYQQKDGKVKIPEVLQSWMQKEMIG